MNAGDYETCPVCGLNYKVLPGGKMRKHNRKVYGYNGHSKKEPCPGSNPPNTASTGQVAIAPVDAGSNHPFGLSVKTADTSSAATRR